MTISEKDLFMAMLSMDSYNRGYDAGIKNLGDVGLGTATILTDSTAKLGLMVTSTAGFYAAAYTTQWGTVISYRGTDFDGIPSPADVAHGWPIGGGSYTADQFKLSTDFLAQVVITREGLTNITLTGHSLGGGLAGNDNFCNEQAIA